MGLMFALIGQFAQGNRQQRPHPKIKIQEKPDFSCGVDATERSCRMSLPKEFWEKLPEKSDAHLYEMLVHKDDYLPEALEAAREEIQKRNLAPEREQELEAFAQVQKAGEDTKTNEPLSWPVRILICTVCPVIVGAILGSYYQNKGYEKPLAGEGVHAS